MHINSQLYLIFPPSTITNCIQFAFRPEEIGNNQFEKEDREEEQEELGAQESDCSSCKSLLDFWFFSVSYDFFLPIMYSFLNDVNPSEKKEN